MQIFRCLRTCIELVAEIAADRGVSTNPAASRLAWIGASLALRTGETAPAVAVEALPTFVVIEQS